MGNIELYQLSDSAIRLHTVNNATHSRAANNYNRAEKHQKRMNTLHALAWIVGIPAFIWSFWFAKIPNPDVEAWKNYILAIIAIVTLSAAMWRQLLKAVKETIEFIKWLMPGRKQRRG